VYRSFGVGLSFLGGCILCPPRGRRVSACAEPRGIFGHLSDLDAVTHLDCVLDSGLRCVRAIAQSG